MFARQMILFDERFIVESSKTAQFARLEIIFGFVIIFVRCDSPEHLTRKNIDVMLSR